MVQIPLTADSEITAFGRDLGAGTVFPTVGPGNTALRRGDAYYHSIYGALFQWNGTAWRARGPGELTAAQRAALVTASIPYAGFQVWETDTKMVWLWDGAAWQAIYGGDGTTTELAYGTGFAGYKAAPWTGVRYWKRAGITTIAGPLQTTAATAANAVVGTLPVGFRPPIGIQVPSLTSGITFTLNADGTLVLGTAQGSGGVVMTPPITFGAA